LERAERLARVDVEQVSKRLEKIRGRAIQTALVGVGTKNQPDKLITDDELIALLKKCGDERADDTAGKKSTEKKK